MTLLALEIARGLKRALDVAMRSAAMSDPSTLARVLNAWTAAVSADADALVREGEIAPHERPLWEREAGMEVID